MHAASATRALLATTGASLVDHGLFCAVLAHSSLGKARYTRLYVTPTETFTSGA